MTFCENLKNIRKQKGMTLEALAAAIGTSKQTVQRYESGMIQSPPYDKIEALALALEVMPAILMGWGDGEDPTGGSNILEEPFAEEARKPEPGKDSRFYLTAPDDSMSGDRIFTGDTVLIAPCGDVLPGRIMAVKTGGELLLRRIYRDERHDALILVAANTTYAPLILVGVECNAVEILGSAVQVSCRI